MELLTHITDYNSPIYNQSSKDTFSRLPFDKYFRAVCILNAGFTSLLYFNKLLNKSIKILIYNIFSEKKYYL
jgi:hypothetical protein